MTRKPTAAGRAYRAPGPPFCFLYRGNGHPWPVATRSAAGEHANELTEADRAASVIRDEIVALGWTSRHRTRPDHPVRLICVAVKPHESYRGITGPECDGLLRLVTTRLDLSASVLRHAPRRGDPGVLRHDRLIVCLLILIDTGERPSRAMYQMVWCYLIGLVSLKELQAFIKTRR